MASITPHKDGWRVQIKILGVRDSATFRTRREAAAWAGARETEIRKDARKPAGEKASLREVMLRYQREVTPTKRGARWESIRLDAMLNMAELPLDMPVAQIVPDDFNAWRALRLRSVSAGTVLREFGILSAVFETARREWRLIPANPVTDVRKPKQPDHRDTIITRPQIKAMLKTLGYSPTLPISTVSQSVAVAFLLALRSGMRAGELCKLEWRLVYDGYCRVPHKTGKTDLSLRDVPLTTKAMLVIEKMRGFDRVRVFGVSSQTLDALFRRARDRSGLSGFTFHDSRHVAATWMAQRLHVLDLCRAFGWSNTGRAMTYYNPKASDIAKRASARQAKD